MTEPGLSETLQMPPGPEDADADFDPPRQPIGAREADLGPTPCHS